MYASPKIVELYMNLDMVMLREYLVHDLKMTHSKDNYKVR